MAAMAANSLLGHVNLPGWFLLLFAIFFAVPDWNEKVRFWLEIAKSSGGYMSIAANILLWQYFPAVLAVIGFLYLVLVWYMVLVRHNATIISVHPIMPAIGWLVFVICFLAVVVTAGAGAVEIYIRTQIAESIAGVPRGTPNENNVVRPQTPLVYDNRTLQPDQIRILLEELPKLRPIQSTVFFSCDQSDGEPLNLFGRYHEIFTRSGLSNQLLYQLPRGPEDVGMMIEVRDIKDIPDDAQKLREAFDVASIRMPIVQMPNNFAKENQALAYAIYIGPAPIH
jgi:hypothetical protein